MRLTMALDLARDLRAMIAEGRLLPGQRINEVALSAELAVSRTPLREALALLSAEGFVEARPHRGYLVQALSEEAVAALYGMRAILDPAALELAGLPDPEQLDRLDALNARLGGTDDVETIIDLDDAWHLTLLARCPNPLLLGLIRQFMTRTRPLERAYLRARGSRKTMATEHARIVERLRAGTLADGVALLRQNMRSGIDPILEWLRRTPPAAGDLRL